MSDDRDREKRIFSEAMGMPADERAAYLSRACGGDPAMRDQIESLIEAMSQAGDQGFLERPTGGASTTSGSNVSDDLLHEEEQHGSLIDKYKILDRIGEGGFGTVYRARQTEPIERDVALKVIKLGMDTRQVISRFEAERQALAIMDHRAIAAVYDAGATKSGRPYFVMELVQGRPVTKLCDEQKFSIRDRLALFQEVCSAIQHAHQKGVIHRDVKPSNVLVSLGENGEPTPKVIDFGIAKATTARLSEHSVHTEARQLVGTPAYMSPEQAGLSQEDIDTRSDIYSLGVLLYEMLTGTTPLAISRSTGSDQDEIRKAIRETVPLKPSSRVGSAETTEEVAHLRRTDRAKLRQELSGDLDWIVMKAIEPDRDRRYETVNALSEDIARYLSSEPITARPPSRAYKISKFVQRNRGAVVASGVLAAVLLLGVVGTGWGLVWALDEREKARGAAKAELDAQIEATEAAEQAASEAQRAAREAETAEELSRFFVIDVLSAADPARTKDKELTVREALINASESIEGRFEGRPDFEVKIHNALGYLFGRLGVLERAEQHHRREWALTEAKYGEVSFENVRIMHSIVGDLAMQERDAEAIELTQRQLAIVDQLNTDEAAQFRLRVIGNLGALLIRSQRTAEAIPILEETLETKREQYGDRHPTTLSTIEALAAAMRRVGEFDRALELLKESYSGQAQVLGEGDPRTLNTKMSLALAHARVDQYGKALSLLSDGLADAKQRLSPDHPTIRYFQSSYARTLFESGQHDLAEQFAVDLLSSLETTDPNMLLEHSRVTLTVLASCLIQRSDFDAALEVADRALTAARSVFTEDDVRLASFFTLRAGILRELGRYQAAEKDLQNAWACVDHENALPDEYGPVASEFAQLYVDLYALGADSRHLEQIEEWKLRAER